MDESDIEVVDNPGEQRYEARAGDGTVLGFSQYQRVPGRVVFTHTEVEQSQEGQGVGSQLARGALDDVRAAGLKVVPRCPFIKAYVDQHPDYADLVDDAPVRGVPG